MGIGFSPIVTTTTDSQEIVIPVKPFQIPAVSLLTPKIINFVSGGSTMGTTFVAWSAYSAPSVQWAVGEGAGVLASTTIGAKINLNDYLKNETQKRIFYDVITKSRKVPIYWYNNVSVGDSLFGEAQLKPFFESGYDSSAKTLKYER